MKNYHLFSSLLVICFILCSKSAYSQEQYPDVIVTVVESSENVVYTFVDQRNIPDENASSFANRIGNLYPNVEKVTFEQTVRTFSIYFHSLPSDEELKSIFGHFNVYTFTLK